MLNRGEPRAARCKVLFAAVLLAATPAHAQLACPLETGDARLAVNRLVASADWSDVRQRLGLPSAAPAEIRRLTDAGDANACLRLSQFVNSMNAEPDWRSRWTVTYFQAAGLYYAVLTPVPLPPVPGKITVDLRFTPVYVLNAQFSLVAGMAT
jgi:hypothetical protein